MRNQRGVTMIGWIFLLVPMAIVLYAGIRVGPEYFNYYKVVSAMKETASQLKSDETTNPQAIKSALAKRFEIGYVDKPAIQEFQIAKAGDGWELSIEYESVVPMFGNLHLLMAFKNTTVIN
jgi:hypothetical protein